MDSARTLLAFTKYKETRGGVALAGYQSSEIRTHHPTDAPATGGCFKLPVQLFHCARGVEAFCQQNDPVQEEKGRNSIDDILHQLYSRKRRRSKWLTDVFGLWRGAMRVTSLAPLMASVGSWGVAGGHPCPAHRNLSFSSNVSNLPRQGRSFLCTGAQLESFNTYEIILNADVADVDELKSLIQGYTHSQDLNAGSVDDVFLHHIKMPPNQA